MKVIRLIAYILIIHCPVSYVASQNVIPFDTVNWSIEAKSFELENFQGKDAIYIDNGFVTLNDTYFLNGSIEFDIYLTDKQAYPGVRFRIFDDYNMESFYLRSHLSGRPDANQVAPVINGITAWQLYFGPSYSFPYKYKVNAWTHVKLVINEKQAQVYLDYAEKPNLSWNLKHTPIKGKLRLVSMFAPIHFANFRINKNEMAMVDFDTSEIVPIERIINEWVISDKFEEKLLDVPQQLKTIIDQRTWNNKIKVEDNRAANISRKVVLRDKQPGNTVFAKLIVESEIDQIKLFEFGYSDRVVVILNGQPIYRGTNKWRSRDYRYLGTIGLFDAVYLNLKKGENTILLAISEDFGGWLVTGRFENEKNITVIQ